MNHSAALSVVISTIKSLPRWVFRRFGAGCAQTVKYISLFAALGGPCVSLAATGTSTTASATFQQIDTSTQGNWPGTYGQDGYIIANGASSPPSYATVNISGASSWTWLASTSDPRALYTSPTGSAASRIASTYFSGGSFTIDLTLSGGSHQVALYLLDLDTTQRAETISILDPNNNNAVLDTRLFSGFHNGEWAIWTVQGHVLIQVTNAGGLNAAVSGFFFGSPLSGPSVSISAPANNATVSNSTTVTATVSSSAPPVSVQFKLDGGNLGSVVTTSPYSIAWDTTTASNGTHSLTAVATDSQNESTTSTPVSVNVSNGSSGGGGPVSPFLTAYTKTNPRTDYSGFVGMSMTVGAQNLYVQSLGRICVSGNTGTHIVKLVSAASGADVSGGSASVSMAGCTPGQFVYANLPSTITLSSRGAYYLVSQETIGGDTWYDVAQVTGSSDATVTGAVYFYNGAWVTNGSGSLSYVPANLQYSTTAGGGGGSPAPPTVSVNPLNSSAVSGTLSISATAAANAPATLASVQFQLDGNNLGSAITTAPYSFNWDTTTANNGTHLLTALATDSLSQSSTSSPLQVTVSNGTSSGGGGTTIPFLTAYSKTTPRSDYSGFVGMSLTVGAQNLYVQSLGRICIGGNTGTHIVKLVTVASGVDVSGGSVSVSMAGCTAGQFVYGNLPNTITLSSGASYYLVSQETLGGDTWYDVAQVTGSADATVKGAIYFYNGAWIANGGGSLSYVPANFQYSTTSGGGGGGGNPAAPTVSVTNPANNATVSGSLTVTASATANSPATVASVQFQLDGTNFGAAVTSSPYSISWDTTEVPNGSHTLSAVVKDSVGQTGSSGAVSVVVNNPTGGGGGGPSAGSALLTGYSATFANLRNDFSGFVGMSFTVNQGSPILVSAVGRICVAGNAESHVVKLVDGGSWQDVSGATATVSMAGCTPGQFVYANLTNAIQLPGGGVYYLVSQELNGGDTWYDAAGVNAIGATVNGAIYFYSGSWVPYNNTASSYVPPNLKFAVAGSSGAPPTVSVTSPVTGGTVSGTAVAVTASVVASAPSTAASVTFYLDGATLGTSTAAASFSINWDSTQTSDGAHTLTAVGVDSAGLTTISAPVVVTVNNHGSASGGTPFVSTFGFYNPTLRNNFSGFAGMQLTVTSATPITVTYVGRACAQSDSGTHTVKFAAQESGVDVPGASAVVNMSGCTPGQFVWSALPSPIFLSPGNTYYLVSEEFNGGDLFYEKGPITTASSIGATVISAVYLQANGVWHRIAPPNYSYVPPNFK